MMKRRNFFKIIILGIVGLFSRRSKANLPFSPESIMEEVSFSSEQMSTAEYMKFLRKLHKGELGDFTKKELSIIECNDQKVYYLFTQYDSRYNCWSDSKRMIFTEQQR